MTEKIVDYKTTYKAAKAIKAGMRLWCIWSETDPYPTRNVGDKKTGFVLGSPQDMRRMGMDLMRLADELEEYSKIWEEDS